MKREQIPFGRKVAASTPATEAQQKLIELQMRVRAAIADHQAATGQKVSFVFMADAKDGNESDSLLTADTSLLDWLKFKRVFESAFETETGSTAALDLICAILELQH